MTTASREKKKAQERELLERARLVYQGFPGGELIAGEGADGKGPDFVFPTERLGVEVTQLFREPTGRTVAPRERESFQEDVVRRAQQVHAQRGEPAVHVTVYFSDETINGLNSVAWSLADYVRTHAPHPLGADLPPGFQSVDVYPARGGEAGRWLGLGSSDAVLLTRDLVAARVVEKNGRLPMYRAKADTVWLLVAATLMPLSSSFIVPDDVESWRFEAGFDKILLFSGDAGKGVRSQDRIEEIIVAERPLTHRCRIWVSRD